MAGSQIIECIAIDVDSKDRQLLLEQFANNPSKRSFELKEVKDENGVILDVEIKIDDYVVGKLSPKDLDLYRNNFYNSSKVKMFVLEEDVDGKSHYGVEVDIAVPYIGIEEKKQKNINTRVTSAIILGTLFLATLIKAIIDKNIGTIVFSVIALTIIIIWVFLKSETKFSQRIQLVKVRAKR